MKMTSLGGKRYRISDSDARRLADAVKAKPPPDGRALHVPLPDGGLAELQRTKYEHFHDAPKRGWIWTVLVSPSDQRTGTDGYVKAR